MDKETTTSVTIDRKTFARLDRLAKSNNVSKKDFLSCALEYFEKYGINPVEHESPAKE
ncbi:mobilization protein BtgA, partial [Phocaeicola vulgatus]